MCNLSGGSFYVIRMRKKGACVGFKRTKFRTDQISPLNSSETAKKTRSQVRASSYEAYEACMREVKEIHVRNVYIFCFQVIWNREQCFGARSSNNVHSERAHLKLTLYMLLFRFEGN